MVREKLRFIFLRTVAKQFVLQPRPIEAGTTFRRAGYANKYR